MRRDRDRADGGEKEEMAVRLPFCHVVGADGAIGAGLVLDDDVLSDTRLELVGNETGDQVRRPAGGKGDDQAHDAGGKVLRTSLRSREAG